LLKPFKRAEQEYQRVEQERQEKEQLKARLRTIEIDPDELLSRE
jgi:hypothetical protein